MFSPRDGARAGMVIGAFWLIGLGVVFLVQQTMDWTWGQAWPLFVILAGVGTLASVAFGVPRSAAGVFAALGWPVLLVVAGVLLLMSTTGTLGVEVGDLVARGWPLAVIAFGAWLLVAAVLPGRGGANERLTLPLAGATDAVVRIKFGGGELRVGRSETGNLVDGDFRGGARSRASGTGRVTLEPDTRGAFPWFSSDWPAWVMGVTAEVPLDLEVEGGASRTLLDLTDHRLRSLRLQTGASETRVLLPRAAGETKVRARAGAASVVFEVPSGVAVRVRSQVALGSTSVDARIPRTGSGWESDDYASAANRVELDVEGGVGSVKVEVAGSSAVS